MNIRLKIVVAGVALGLLGACAQQEEPPMVQPDPVYDKFGNVVMVPGPDGTLVPVSGGDDGMAAGGGTTPGGGDVPGNGDIPGNGGAGGNQNQNQNQNMIMNTNQNMNQNTNQNMNQGN